MTNIWILRLLQHSKHEAEWAYWGEDNKFTKGPTSGKLKKAAKDIGDSDVLVLVPGVDVSVLTEMIPAKQRQQVIKAIPYAMEEQVSRDVESLHFALGEKGHDGSFLVAVVDHKKMRQWVLALEKAGINATHMMPDSLAVPYEKGVWNIICDDKVCMVRADDTTAFAMDSEHLIQQLQMEYEPLDATKRPLKIQLMNIAKNIKEQIRQTFQTTEVVDAPNSGNFLQTFAEGIGDRPFVNLIQQAYEKKDCVSQVLKYWLPVVAILALWFVTQLGGKYYEYSNLKAQDDNLYSSIRELYKSTFPKDKIVNPRRQLKNHLIKLKSTGKGNQFLPLLAIASEQLHTQPDIRILSFRYSEAKGDMELELETKNFQRFEAVRQSLASVLDVQVRTSNISKNNLVQGSLKLKRKQ